MSDAFKQPVDWGFGYAVEGVTGRTHTPSGGVSQNANRVAYHGPFAEIGYYPWALIESESVRLRAGGLASLELLWAGASTGNVGGGATLAAALEWTGMARGPVVSHDDSSRSVFVGYGYGQWSIGLYAAGSVRDVDSDMGWAFTMGLTAKLPLIAGLICCVNPFQSSRR